MTKISLPSPINYLKHAPKTYCREGKITTQKGEKYCTPTWTTHWQLVLWGHWHTFTSFFTAPRRPPLPHPLNPSLALSWMWGRSQCTEGGKKDGLLWMCGRGHCIDGNMDAKILVWGCGNWWRGMGERRIHYTEGTIHSEGLDYFSIFGQAQRLLIILSRRRKWLCTSINLCAVLRLMTTWRGRLKEKKKGGISNGHKSR